MVSRLINLSCFLSFSSWILLGFCQNLGEQSNPCVGNPGEMGNVSQGLEGILGKAEELGSSSSDAMSCIQILLPCKSYLKSSSPPSSCCDALKEMVSKDSQCLCSVFDNPEILKSLNITQDEALNLPKACDVDADISKCKAAYSPDNSSTKPSPYSPSSDNSFNNDSSSSSSKPGATFGNPQLSIFDFIAFFGSFVFLSF